MIPDPWFNLVKVVFDITVYTLVYGVLYWLGVRIDFAYYLLGVILMELLMLSKRVQ